MVRIRGRSVGGFSSALLEADGAGHWLVDGDPAGHLDDCLDVDLEASAMTNALPVRRMGLPVGAQEDAPAACAVWGRGLRIWLPGVNASHGLRTLATSRGAVARI